MKKTSTLLVATVLLLALLSGGAAPARAVEPPPSGVLRIATYNVAMYRDRAGELFKELDQGNSTQASSVAEVLQRVRPHIVLLNEFDFEARPAAPGQERLPAAFVERYAQKPQAGLAPLEYPHRFYAPVNTGVDSGMDLDGDGRLGGPADGWGYGTYPGQYGMLLLSKFPINAGGSHTFQNLRWKDLAAPTWPTLPGTGALFYTGEQTSRLRLPSKSFWDVSVSVPLGAGQALHLLCSHPTPPVFDGSEDRNGCRNYDEIRMLAEYIGGRGKAPFRDDRGDAAGMPEGAAFVVLGDLNADPVDGSGREGAIAQLLEHPAIDASFVPKSEGAVEASRVGLGLNGRHRGDPAHDTADFGGDGVANLRVDYVLPSKGLKVAGGGVFWPKRGEPGAEAVRASDHRLVWLDIDLNADGAAPAEP